MADDVSNDNDPARARVAFQGPDAHGQAAMLLVESLIHGLIARSVISVEDAIEVVRVAADVKEEIGAELGDSPATLQTSLTLLGAIEASLQPDVGRD